MAVFVPVDRLDGVAVRYAAGLHAEAIAQASRPIGSGVVGWVAAHRRAIVNGDPAMDLGHRAAEAPALRACLCLPLVEADALVGVLALYATAANAFTNDQARLLELLAPRLANLLLDSLVADEDPSTLANAAPPLKLVKRS
jgi:GAF domain-containing protein